MIISYFFLGENFLMKLEKLIVSSLLLLQLSIANALVISEDPSLWNDPIGKECLNCHRMESNGLYHEWNKSKHGQSGVNCFDCHRAKMMDPDAFLHEGHYISLIVSPKDCARCHKEQNDQFQRSPHASAADTVNSLDYMLGHKLAGPEVTRVGCEQCHGTKIEIDEEGKPTKETWPNTGIGRINPDGSVGSCTTACHSRHAFSRAQARTPETCGKCHTGPDHSHIEIYNESKHGVIFHSNRSEMNLESDKWVAGIDYSIAPTCATCHISAAPGVEKTHDVSERLSWNLRDPISYNINLVRLENGKQYDLDDNKTQPNKGDTFKDSTVKKVINWRERRSIMKNVCYSCHTRDFVNGYYKQLKDIVSLYNNKFAKPLQSIMDDLVKMGKITKVPFDDKIEWIWWEIWHRDGRRARQGSAMSGPNYVWWQGGYELVKHTYIDFITELKQVVGKKEANRLLKKYMKPIKGYEWYFDAISLAEPCNNKKALPSLGEAQGYKFAGGVSLNGGEHTKTLQQRLADKIEICATIVGDKAAEMVVIAETAKFKYNVTANGQGFVWNEKPEELGTFQRDANPVAVPTTESIKIWSGKMEMTGNIKFHIWSRLADGTLVKAPEAIDVNIAK
jgi:hypothetical protein